MAKISCTATIVRPMRLLKVTGLWPMKELNIIVTSKILFNVAFDITTFSVVMHNILIAIETKNIKLLNWMICIVFPLTNFFAKTVPLWTNKANYLSAMRDLSSKPFNMHTEELNRHIQTTDKISKFVLRYFVMATTVFVAAFSLLPFFTKVPLMVPAPFNTGKYDSIYKLAHLFSTVYLSMNSASIDCFYMSLIALCSAQLNILQEKVINVFRDAQDSCKSSEEWIVNITAEDILKECIVLHDKINMFVKKLSAILSFPLLLQYAYGCFIICNTILQLTILGERDSGVIIGLCGYSGIVFAQMSVYHWLGNEIIFKSNKIIDACVASEWYKLNVKCQKHLILLMERAKRSLVVSLYELAFVSLDSLGVMVRWAYSVFALIKARYN